MQSLERISKPRTQTLLNVSLDVTQTNSPNELKETQDLGSCRILKVPGVLAHVYVSTQSS